MYGFFACFRVGGLRFIRVWRFQVSFCVLSQKTYQNKKIEAAVRKEWREVREQFHDANLIEQPIVFEGPFFTDVYW